MRRLLNPPRQRVDNSGRDMARLQVVGGCALPRNRYEQVIQMGEQFKRDVGPMSESRLPLNQGGRRHLGPRREKTSPVCHLCGRVPIDLILSPQYSQCDLGRTPLYRAGAGG